MDGVLWIEGLYVDRGPMWIQLACCGRYVDPVSMLRSLKRSGDLWIEDLGGSDPNVDLANMLRSLKRSSVNLRGPS